MATKYIEAVGTAAGDAATALTGVLRKDAAGNVYPIVFDAVDGILKYYDRVRSVTAQQALLNQPLISATAALAVTEALHTGRTIVLNLVAGFTVTLPTATASGNKYRFVVGIASNAYVIAATAGTTFLGGYIQDDTGGSAAVTADFMPAVAGNNTYSPTTAGGGGAIGDWIEFEDILANTYVVRGANQGVIDPTNRFSTV